MATSVLLLLLYCNDATLLPVFVMYNNSNRTDVAMPAGCCDDAEARGKTQR